ncbi:kinase-like protein [Rhizophagus irregularis]|uniref:Kinase-like protein n=1 Tax=Rhizophagus irregularis TaxID=588596 RepID=A0A2N1NV50_9GLOM|nr:kinase-like protein [Rhizophagus irregularis]
MQSFNEWTDKKIKDDNLYFFKYNKFTNVEIVEKGTFATISKADWKNGISVAFKILGNNPSINENDMNKFIKEFKNLRRASFHSNINRLYGITKEPSTNTYMMVLQYVNQGNLRDYLKKNFDSLQWSDKIKMALDITRGLKCLHSRKIIHRNLHAKNILVHSNKLMIADLALFKQLAGVESNSGIHEMLGYVEPQCHKVVDYVRDKKSDIYSLGVLLWEISSGYPPYSKIPIHNLVYKINTGFREQPITDTPSAYVELYEKCWDDNPSLRPTIEEVFFTLQKISQQINANNENGSKITEDLDKLDINNETNSDSINQNDSKLQISKTKNDNIDKNKNELSNILSEIIQAYLERNKIGKTKSFNFDTILEKYKSKSREIFKYLIKNTSTKHYEVMVGKFHKEGFGTIKNEGVAFKWFMKASKNDDINGHYEVGYCYFYACGTEDNDEKACTFYEQGANKGLNIALDSLAFCYKHAIGVPKDRLKTFELYKKSAENGYVMSQYELARCYQNGIGTQINQKKALKWYELYQKNSGTVYASHRIKYITKELNLSKKN